MLKDYFKTEEQLKDYNTNVEVFNKNNPFKIGDKIFIELSHYKTTQKYSLDEDGYVTELFLLDKKTVEVRVDLCLYGISDENCGITEFEFQPVFIIGDSKVPKMGQEYADRVFRTEFSLLKNSLVLPSSNYIRFNSWHYKILGTEDESKEIKSKNKALEDLYNYFDEFSDFEDFTAKDIKNIIKNHYKGL